MSTSQVRIYHVKAEDLFYLIPYKGMIDFNQVSSQIDICWLECLFDKLKNEYTILCQTFETLIEIAYKGEKDFEFSTIHAIYENSNTVGSNPYDMVNEVYEEQKSSEGNERQLRKLCVILFAFKKHAQALVDELKSISKHQPVFAKEKGLEKLSDLPSCLERLELSKDLEKMTRKALAIRIERYEVLSSEKFGIVMSANYEYNTQMKKLMSVYYDVFELLIDLRAYREKDKIVHDFVDLKYKAKEVIVSKSEIDETFMRGGVLNFKSKLGLMMQENIKQCEKVCDELLSLYKTFPKLPKN